jgi:cell division protein FtsW (lipid II flippase)
MSIFFDWRIWAGFFIIGMVLGVIMHATQNAGKIIKPRRDDSSWHLGFILDMVWGGIGSILMVLMMLSIPNDFIRAIILSIVGGISGRLIVLSLVKKITKITDQTMDQWLDSDVNHVDLPKYKDHNNKDFDM